MALPIIQPVDWPDWGALPVSSSAISNFTTIASPGDVITTIDARYFSHVLLTFYGDGDGADWEVGIQHLIGNPVEGFSMQWQQNVVRMFGQTVFVPITVWMPYIRLVDVDSSVYPHNMLISVSLFSERGFLTGYPGSPFTLNQAAVVPASTPLHLLPVAVGPGTHAIHLDTDGDDWDLILNVWRDAGSPSQFVLADETTGNLRNHTFLAPASAWSLFYSNNNAGNDTIEIAVIREP